MDALLIMVAAAIGYIAMYRIYGKFIGKHIMKLNASAKVPSGDMEDGIDYVPTKREVIFGHHFTSIAGTGPIVGPAIAIIWGWVPALIWVFVGSIFMGAIHDFGALIISMRNKGKSLSEFTAKYITPNTRFYFFIIIFLELWLVIAIFGLVISVIFDMYPSSVIPVWIQVAIALNLGFLVNKKGKNILYWSLISVILMYLTVILGTHIPVSISEIAGIPATGIWTIILLIYAYIASILPVTTLLQPRDFINSYQLLIAMGLMVLGVFFGTFTADMKVVAPEVQMHPQEAPPLWPFLFITIACGAVSGFHSLVASGTSAKQVRNEPDALFVGYGSMITEGFLATLVIIAVAAGIGLGYEQNGQMLVGTEAWTNNYASWTAVEGLNDKVGSFVIGAANMVETTGIPLSVAIAIMGVFVASFAATTMDSATRVQRYVVTELFDFLGVKPFKNMYFTTFVVVATAALLAFVSGAGGKGALTLWPLFGAINQTLAGLALIVITMYLRRKSTYKWVISGLPAVFMVIMTLWASVLNEINFINDQNWLLAFVNGMIILLVVLVVIEGMKTFFAVKPQQAMETA
ncbi:MAG: carbon starvation CstA family protein [Bacteroidota bacterium]